MKTVAYLRVSTRSQDLANQKLAIRMPLSVRLFRFVRLPLIGSLHLSRGGSSSRVRGKPPSETAGVVAQSCNTIVSFHPALLFQAFIEFLQLEKSLREKLRCPTAEPLVGQPVASARRDMVNTYIHRATLEDWQHGDFDSTCS